MMAKRGKAKLVDGYTTLRATQRYGVERKYSTRSESQEEEAEEKKKDAAKAGTTKRAMSIGRTVMPTQNEIVCYSCGFSFVMRGRADSTQCPKCGARLGLKDETITGAFSEELITAGKVRITKSAIVDGGTIVANDLVLEGTVKGGSVRAYKTLELAAGAVIPEDSIVAKHLRIGAEASFDFKSDMAFHDIEIFGELKANLKATGMVTIHAGGHLLGKLQSEHLVVEDGGGLNAEVTLEREEEEIADAEESVSDEEGEVRKTA